MKRKGIIRTRAGQAFLFAFLLAAGNAHAQTTARWANAVSGVFSNPANWQAGAVPAGPDDLAWYDHNSAAFTVTFTESITNYNARMLGSDSTFTWDLGGNLYYLRSGENPWLNGSLYLRTTLIVTNGHLSSGTTGIGEGGFGHLILRGPDTQWTSRGAEVNVRLLGQNVNASLTIEDGARAQLAGIRLGNSGTFTAAVTVAGQGSSVTNTGTLGLGRRNVNSILTLADGAHWQQDGAFTKHFENDQTMGAVALNFEGGTMAVSHSGGLNLAPGVGITPSVNKSTTLRFTLFTGATNAALTVAHTVTLGTNTVFEVSLDPGFSAKPYGEVFTLVQGGGWNGQFLDTLGQTIIDGTLFTLSSNGEDYEFVANYTGDNAFTLTTIPEPGTLALLGAMLFSIWFTVRRRTCGPRVGR